MCAYQSVTTSEGDVRSPQQTDTATCIADNHNYCIEYLHAVRYTLVCAIINVYDMLNVFF